MESHNIKINMEEEVYAMNKNNISVNKSGCSDPTACQAIKNMDSNKEMGS